MKTLQLTLIVLLLVGSLGFMTKIENPWFSLGFAVMSATYLMVIRELLKNDEERE